jgi:conjugative transfer signal peptidase TraF
MKPVAAIPGDHVCTDNRKVLVNGKPFGRIREADSEGRALRWFHYCGLVKVGHVFTFSENPRSFDSRYYGPIDLSDILARAEPLWTS